MAVKFADFGKDAKDLLSKNFHNGVIKIEGKTKSTSGVEFKTDGTQAGDKVAGGLEAKSAVTDGVTFTGKWNLNNLYSGTLALNDKLVPGLKADLDASVSAASGKRSLSLKSTYAKGAFVTTHDIDLEGPTVHGSAVAEVYKGWMVGAQGSYDTGSSKMTGTGFGLSYVGADYKVHSGIVNMDRYFASIYHNVNGGLQTAASLGWASDGSAPSLTVGTQYALDASSFCKVKIDNTLQMGLSYTTKLRDGVQVTLSSLVDGAALNGGGHKFGLSLNMSA